MTPASTSSSGHTDAAGLQVVEVLVPTMLAMLGLGGLLIRGSEA